MSIATIKIYGRDDAADGNIVSPVTAIETGTEGVDWSVWETDVHAVNAGIEDETEEKTYLNYYKISSAAYRGRYDIIPAMIDYPTSQTAVATVYPFLKILDKNFLWLWLNDYKIATYNNTVTNALRVYRDSSFEIEPQSGKKRLSLTLLELKRSLDRT